MGKVLLFSNSNTYSGKVRKELERLLRDHAIAFVAERRHGDENEESLSEVRVVVVIGGDGTMLSAIRKYRVLGVPFVGIDTGTLGFLNTIMPEECGKIIDVLNHHKYRIEKYPTIAVEMTTTDGKKRSDYAFNEVIVRHYEPRLLHSKVYLNGSPFNYFTGDGLVVSTPIGATGYAIWTGGSVVHTDLPAYQITPLAPNDNSVNRPLSSSVIIPATTKIAVEVMAAEKRKVAVAVDGKHSTDDYVERIDLTLDMENPVEIIRSDNFDYFDLFRRKIIDKNIRRKLGD